MPKRQQTVKIEPLDRLHRAQFVDAAGERGEAESVEYRNGGGMQERQVAEAGRAACNPAPAALASMFFSFASQAMAVLSSPISSTSLRVDAPGAR